VRPRVGVRCASAWQSSLPTLFFISISCWECLRLRQQAQALASTYGAALFLGDLYAPQSPERARHPNASFASAGSFDSPGTAVSPLRAASAAAALADADAVRAPPAKKRVAQC
jgi:hypothetical protein